MKGLLDLLSGWPGGEQLPELWQVLEAGNESVATVAMGWLEHLAIPRSLPSTLKALVDRGAFAATELLLSVVDLGSAEFKEWQYELESARSEARVLMEDELERLLTRSGRASCPIPDLEARIEQIVNLTALDREAAEKSRQKLTTEVEEWEDLYRRTLTEKLKSRLDDLHGDSRVPAWQAHVERSIEAAHFDLATDSIKAGPDESFDEALLPLPQPPMFWPFSEPAQVVCSWLREDGEARREVFSVWAPTDDAACEMMQRLDSLLSPEAGEIHAQQFLQSLEVYLGIQLEPEPVRVVRTAAGFNSVVRGLYHPAMPAFNPHRFPQGVPITLVVGESEAPPEIAPGTQLVFSEQPFDVDPGVAEIRPQDLFRLLPEPHHRKWQMLRFIGGQIKLDDALCPAALQPHGELVFGREAQSAAIRSSDHCIIYGAPGVGKSALLMRILLDLGKDGWQQLSFDAGGADKALLDELGCFTSSGSDQIAELLHVAKPCLLATVKGCEVPGLALGIDRADALSAETLTFLARCLTRRDLRIRLFLVGSPGLGQRLEAISFPRMQYYHLGPLPFNLARRFAEEILDLHGVQWSGEDILDRIAHSSSGRPALLLLLMRELFVQHEVQAPTRRKRITNDLLDFALRSDGFRESAIAAVLQPIDDNADLQCVLAAFLLELREEREPSGGITDSDLQLWLSLSGIGLTEAEVDRGLDSLRQLGIIERRGPQGELFLARGTLGSLAQTFIDRPMAFLEGEKQRRKSEAEKRVGGLENKGGA
jgi:hypothetical protein